jgi:cyclophilin family peptidyl-prolyl cis-trans isomerase
MKKIFSLIITLALFSTVIIISGVSVSAKTTDQTAEPKDGDTIAILHTNYGDIGINFFDEEAPKGVENFLTLAKDGKYDSTIFHRVRKGFVIQGGDYTNFDGTGGESCWGEKFENECVDNLSNIRGSVAYANSGTDTNASQFYINTADNSTKLDGNYTIFGQVFSGMDVVDLISDCEVTYNSSGEYSSPVNEVSLESVEVTKYSSDTVSSLAEATDPYENTSSDSSESSSTTTGSDDSVWDIALPIAIAVGVIVVIFAAFAIPYAISDRKKKKAKAEAKAKLKASPDYKKKKATKKK